MLFERKAEWWRSFSANECDICDIVVENRDFYRKTVVARQSTFVGLNAAHLEGLQCRGRVNAYGIPLVTVCGSVWSYGF